MPNWPRWCEWRRGRWKELFRAKLSLVTGGEFEPRGCLAEDRCPTRGQKGWLQPKCWCQCCFMVEFCENLVKLPARAASSRTRSQTALSKLRTPRSMRLCTPGLKQSSCSRDMSDTAIRKKYKSDDSVSETKTNKTSRLSVCASGSTRSEFFRSKLPKLTAAQKYAVHDVHVITCF